MNAIRLAFFVFILGSASLHAQQGEGKEFRGILRGIEPGFYFAYSMMTIEVNGELIDLQFPVTSGRMIKDSFKPGDSILLRTTLNSKILDAATRKQVRENGIYMVVGQIVSINRDGTWTELQYSKRQFPKDGEVVLNLRVSDIYVADFPKALLFANGVIGFTMFASHKYNPLGSVSKGDKVSFVGMEFPVPEGSVYPVEDVKKLYALQLLERATGSIRSLLFKQNYVCIGISVTTHDGERAVSFPSELARDVERFADGRQVDIYLLDYQTKGQLPELHAIVSGEDTLLIRTLGFYGGPDSKHEHVPVALSGKVTRVNKSDTGRTIGLILDERVFIEVDINTARQMGELLKKGRSLEVVGDERVKKEGEIYSKDYRIVVPHKITVDGKVFLINTRP